MRLMVVALVAISVAAPGWSRAGKTNYRSHFSPKRGNDSRDLDRNDWWPGPPPEENILASIKEFQRQGRTPVEILIHAENQRRYEDALNTVKRQNPSLEDVQVKLLLRRPIDFMQQMQEIMNWYTSKLPGERSLGLMRDDGETDQVAVFFSHDPKDSEGVDENEPLEMKVLFVRPSPGRVQEWFSRRGDGSKDIISVPVNPALEHEILELMAQRIEEIRLSLVGAK